MNHPTDNLTATPDGHVAIIRWQHRPGTVALWVGTVDGVPRYSIEYAKRGGAHGGYRVWWWENGRCHPLTTFDTTLEAAAYARGDHDARTGAFAE